MANTASTTIKMIKIWLLDNPFFFFKQSKDGFFPYILQILFLITSESISIIFLLIKTVG